MMVTFALDPGTERSALVRLTSAGDLVTFQLSRNEEILHALALHVPMVPVVLVIEDIQSYGKPVGSDVFRTVLWAGRFVQAWEGPNRHWVLLPRRAVKLALCDSPRATDAMIRQALIDRYGPGREKAIGTKKRPGPLYGIKADCWQALALGITYLERQGHADPHH